MKHRHLHICSRRLHQRRQRRAHCRQPGSGSRGSGSNDVPWLSGPCSTQSARDQPGSPPWRLSCCRHSLGVASQGSPLAIGKVGASEVILMPEYMICMSLAPGMGQRRGEGRLFVLLPAGEAACRHRGKLRWGAAAGRGDGRPQGSCTRGRTSGHACQGFAAAHAAIIGRLAGGTLLRGMPKGVGRAACEARRGPEREGGNMAGLHEGRPKPKGSCAERWLQGAAQPVARSPQLQRPARFRDRCGRQQGAPGVGVSQ